MSHHVCVLHVCADHVPVSKVKPDARTPSGCCCRQAAAVSNCVPFPSNQLRPCVVCRDWEVLEAQISLSASKLSKISVVQSQLVATVTFQVPDSCDGTKTLTVGLGG